MALDALVTGWHGQGALDLPGGVGCGARLGDSWQSRRSRGSRLSESNSTPTSRTCSSRRTQIKAKIAELAKQIDADYADREPLLVGVLKGAVMFMSDLARALQRPSTMEFMAVSSYGSATTSSGVVRILKDLDRDIAGQHVLIVEDIIDSGLTLSWLLKNLAARQPASIEVVALLRKPDAIKVHGRR